MKIELSKSEIELLLDLMNYGFDQYKNSRGFDFILPYKRICDKLRGKEKDDNYYKQWLEDMKKERPWEFIKDHQVDGIWNDERFNK
jgi:hypothetical protein